MELRPIVDTFWTALIPFYAILEEASGRTIDEVSQDIRAVEMPRREPTHSGFPREAHRYSCFGVMLHVEAFSSPRSTGIVLTSSPIRC